MYARLFIQFILCLGILLCILASTTTAGEYGTVITKTGVKYENVYITIDHNLQIVNVLRGTEEIKIGFGACESITNTAGQDITKELLTDTSVKKDETSGAGLYATVVTKSDAVYENAYIIVDHSLQVISLIISLTGGTEESKIGFGAIKSITNAAGKDITDELLGEIYRKKEKPASTGEYGAVVTKSGDKYRDVYITADHNLGVVRIVKGTEETKIGFSAIESITNAAGRDITSELLGESYGKKEKTLGPSTYGLLVTKSGHAYEIANLIADHNLNVVRIIKGKDETRVGFDEIESITDLAGKDITEKFLGTSYSQKGDTRSTQISPGMRRYPAKPWHFGASILGTYSKPFGDYYRGVNGGMGIEGNIFVALKGGLALKFIVAKPGMSFAKEEDLPSGIRAKISAIKFISGVQYTMPYPYEMKSGKFIFHGMFGLGVISHRVSVEGHHYYYDPYTGITEDIWIDESDTKANLITYWDFGTIFLVSRNVGLDFSLAYAWVLGTKTGGYYYATTMPENGNIFEIRGGLVFMF